MAAAFSTGPATLIATRALLGVAGATLMPSTLDLIRTIFPDPRARGTAISIWMSCFMGGMTVGPLVGGALLEAFWWGAAFLMGVPVMVLLLVVGSVPEEKAGSPSALSETSGELGVALGVATLGSLATAVYRDALVLPPGTPASLADAARAGITQVAAAGPPPAPAGAVEAAFTAGLGVAATVGAVVFGALAVVATVALRHVPVTAAAADEPRDGDRDTGREQVRPEPALA